MAQQLTELQEKWLQALESGEYRQGVGRLGTPEDGLCCLGVLCVTAGVDYDENAFYPSRSLGEAVRLRSCRSETAKRFSVNGASCSSLIDANDDAKASFAQIAAAIRANPENFFLPPEAQS